MTLTQHKIPAGNTMLQDAATVKKFLMEHNNHLTH
jgi:hypothetical protein